MKISIFIGTFHLIHKLSDHRSNERLGFSGDALFSPRLIKKIDEILFPTITDFFRYWSSMHLGSIQPSKRKTHFSGQRRTKHHSYPQKENWYNNIIITHLSTNSSMNYKFSILFAGIALLLSKKAQKYCFQHACLTFQIASLLYWAWSTLISITTF